MTILFVILLLSLGTVLGTTIALYLRVRRQLQASENALREALHELDELEHQRESTKV